MDTVSVIDLTEPVHVIDHITVPDSPEGLAFSPKGNIAVAVEATGSNHPKSDWYYHPHGMVTVLKIDGKKVTRLNDIEVGALPEAVAFTPDGKYIYVGNYIDIFDPARGRHQSHRYRQAFQSAGPARLRSYERALEPAKNPLG